MNSLNTFNHVIQFTIYQHFTYQIILLMSKINLHIIKLIKSCGSCEHIQKSNYLRKKFICHCKYNCHCFITIMDIQSKWARRAIKPLFLIKLSLFWRPYLEFVDTEIFGCCRNTYFHWVKISLAFNFVLLLTLCIH